MPHDARSFYNLIKMNKLKSGVEDGEAIAVLEEELRARVKAADAAGLQGDKAAAFFFFQGALIGIIIENKRYTQHLRVQAQEQHVKLEDPHADSH